MSCLSMRRWSFTFTIAVDEFSHYTHNYLIKLYNMIELLDLDVSLYTNIMQIIQ